MLVTVIVLFALSLLGTGYIRRLAINNNALDIPNHRSSHILPTPRGGGLVFVLLFLLYALYVGYLGLIPVWIEIVFTIAGFSIACLGFIDDHLRISAKQRLIWHFLISAFALYGLNGMPAVAVLPWSPLVTGILINLFALIYLVWLLNLYNFMDGIDGLAAVESITVCLSGSLIFSLQFNRSAMLLPLALSAVVAGFLYWNSPKARIFMGDTGSGFLGLMIGLFSIQATKINHHLFWCWLILSGVFVVDATVTLICRAITGKPIFKAHRSHAYQRATDVFKAHFTITLSVLIINVLWLLPLAILVSYEKIDGILAVIIAYLPLILLVFQFRSTPSISDR